MRRLVLGADGGGSKTAVRIAAVGDDGALELLGEGFGGPSNVRAVGRAHAEINLNVAVDAALRDAGISDEPIACAVLALAGSSLPDVKAFIHGWAERRALAAHIDVVHDADPVLAAGVPEGNGIALIVGTGSAAIGVDASGQRTVTGGWGHWIGDAGSGFDLGRRALAAVADSADGIGGDTLLSNRILVRLASETPRELLKRLDHAVDARREIAALAPLVLHAAAEGDEVALDIVVAAARAAAMLVKGTVDKLGLAADAPLAVAGGVACSKTIYLDTLLGQLKELGIRPARIAEIREPVEGCLLMARDRLPEPA